jgi:PAS domain S-box-containing protein
MQDVDTQITEERLSSERNRILFAALPASSAASLVLASLLVFVLWRHAGGVRSLIWFAAFVFVTALRLWVRSRYRSNRAIALAPHYERLYIAGAAAGGAVWGLATALMYAADPAHQVFIAFVIAGVSAGAVSTIGASATASALFLSLSLFPLAVRLLLTGGVLPVTMSVMTFLFLIFLIVSTRRIAATLHDNIVLRFEEEGRKEAQRIQAELLQRMGAIARLGTWELDTRTNVVRWSDHLYSLLGARLNESPSVGRTFQSFPEPGRSEIDRGIRESIGSGEPFETEQPMVASNGDELWMRLVISPVVQDGAVTRIQGIVQDITERRRVEVLKSEFVSTVSHELRTPLTSIRGAVGLIANGATGELPPRAKAMLDIALRNCERLIVLINDILDVEKIESGEADFTIVRQEVMPLIVQAVESTAASTKDGASRIEVTGDSSLTADVDAPRLVQVFINLLSNALKFSPADTVVNVALASEDGFVTVSVTDQGPGISDEFLPRLFAKFSQADSSDRRRIGGTGLGLAISRVIAENMGGRITVDTEAGRGSTFTVHVPLSRALQPAHSAASVTTGRTHLLLCIPDGDNADEIVSLLEAAGCRLTIANQVAAITQHLAADGSIDACVLWLGDVQENARWLRDWFRATRQTGRKPLVAVGSMGDVLVSGLRLPIVEWLMKPASADALQTALLGVLDEAAPGRLLHVEDDVDLLRTVREVVGGRADVDSAETVSEARVKLGSRMYDAVLLDPGLPDGSGYELIGDVMAAARPARIVVFSATGPTSDDVHLAARALLKPLDVTSDMAFTSLE